MNVRASIAALLLIGFGTASRQAEAQINYTVFTNSQDTILSMVDDGTGTNVKRYSGLAAAGGNIVALGSAADMQTYIANGAKVINLNGTNALLPGFVDPHSHLFATAEYQLFASVRPVPFTSIQTMDGVYAALNAWAKTNRGGLGPILTKKWIVGTGFDPSNFSTNALPQYHQSSFPTRLDLDVAFPKNPVVMIHYSGHIAVCNTLALQKASMLDVTTNSDILLYPTNNIIPKSAQGTPNGILLESAVIQIAKTLLDAVPTLALRLPDLLATAQQQLATQGITTTQEGAATDDEIVALRLATIKRPFIIDVVDYLAFVDMAQVTKDIDFLKRIGRLSPNTYTNHLRVGGIKLILDGTPPAETAWVSSPYLTYIGLQNITDPANYTGVSDITNATVNAAVAFAYQNNVQIMAHVNGDAALNQFLTAIQLAPKNNAVDFHPVAIHSQIANQTQIQQMQSLDVVPSFFPDHVYYFGEQYVSTVLGPSRATNICATGWAKQLNIPFTLHNDTPVMPNNLLMAMWAAVNRVTYDYTNQVNSYVLGPSQQITVLDALKAITINAARQYGEDSFKGSLAVGNLADLVILDQDPTVTPPSDLLNRVVVKTFKEGSCIYTNLSFVTEKR